MLGLSRGDWTLLGRGLRDRIHQPRRAHLYPRSMELVERAEELGALGASISGAGPTVLLWSHYERTGGLMAAVKQEAEGWAEVLRAPFEPMGADVREL
jgi:homoserine kinase